MKAPFKRSELASAGETSLSEREESKSFLGFLKHEQWIVNLGNETVPGDETGTQTLERRERVEYRLDNEDQPWTSLPAAQLKILSSISDAFSREEVFDEPSNCEAQNNALEDMSNAVENQQEMGRPLFFDFCRHFMKNEYPLMRNFENYCVLHSVSRVGSQDPRMLVLINLAHFWKLYERTIQDLEQRFFIQQARDRRIHQLPLA